MPIKKSRGTAVPTSALMPVLDGLEVDDVVKDEIVEADDARPDPGLGKGASIPTDLAVEATDLEAGGEGKTSIST